MFPFDIEEDDLEVIEEDTTTAEPSDYEVDFSTGQLTGRIITGLPAIIQWIRLALGTERYFYNQFSGNYGSELRELIGQSYSEEYIESEVTRMITDALSINENIEGISTLETSMENDTLHISFTVNTPYGSGEVQVDV